jgi:hypothetical protein
MEQNKKRYIKFPLFPLENLMGRDHLQGLGIYGRIILKWICEK